MKLEGTIGDHGPMATVTVRVDGAAREVQAILDTGARVSLLDERVALELGAPERSPREIVGACGPCTLRRFEVDVLFAGLELTGVMPSHQGLVGAGILVGQDVLSRGKLTVDGPRRRWTFET